MSFIRNEFWYNFILKMIICIIIFFIGIGLFTFFKGMKKQPKKNNGDLSVPIVRTFKVAKKDYFPEYNVYGNCEPIQFQKILAEVNGKIEFKIQNLDVGTSVNKNQLIAVIDPTEYRIQLNQILLNIKRLNIQLKTLEVEYSQIKESFEIEKNNYDLLKKEYKRNLPLLKKKYISEDSFDKLKINLKKQEQQLNNLETNVEITPLKIQELKQQIAIEKLKTDNIKRLLEKTEIRADFNGVISSKFVNNGEFMSVNKPILEIYNPQKMKIYVYAPLEKIKFLFPNLNVSEQDVIISNIEEHSEKKCVGVLKKIGTNIELKTRSVDMLVEFDNSDNFFIKGEFCKVILKGSCYKNVTVLPADIVFGKNTVYKVEDGFLKKMELKDYIEFENDFIIRESFKDGDLILVSRLSNPYDKLKVKLLN